MEKGREELSNIKVKSDDMQAFRWTNGELMSLIVCGGVCDTDIFYSGSKCICMCACIFSTVLTGVLGLIQTPACTGAGQGDRRSNEDECVCVCFSEGCFSAQIKIRLADKNARQATQKPNTALFSSLSSPFFIPPFSHSLHLRPFLMYKYRNELLVFVFLYSLLQWKFA